MSNPGPFPSKLVLQLLLEFRSETLSYNSISGNQAMDDYWASGGTLSQILYGDPRFCPTWWDEVEDEWHWVDASNPKNRKGVDKNMDKGAPTELLKRLVRRILSGINNQGLLLQCQTPAKGFV